jgi:hypothetical protein
VRPLPGKAGLLQRGRAGLHVRDIERADPVEFDVVHAPGGEFEDGSKTLESKQAGMMFQGTNQIAANYVSDNKNLSDLAFFEYPEINPAYGQSYMDASMDGFVLPALSARSIRHQQRLHGICGPNRRPGPRPQKAGDATAGAPRTFPARTSPLAHRTPADPHSERGLPQSRKAYP